MKIKMIIFCCFLFFIKAGAAQTIPITNFNDLIESLKTGEQIRVVIHYNQCSWQDTADQTPIPDAIAGMNIDTYEYFAPGAVRNKNAFIVFSTAKLIQNPKGKGFVYNYGKVRINSDNTVEVTAKYVHPKNYKVLMNEVFVGKINDGKNGEGIHLFAIK